MATPDFDTLSKTPLFDFHQSAGGKLVEFAGYALPVQYKLGVMKEHQHTREKAGLFDVSHMGQAVLAADGDVADCMESLVPGAIKSLKPGRMRYSLLLNDQGGIIDDLMITRPARPLIADAPQDQIYMVVNGACKAGDFAHIAGKLEGKAQLLQQPARALLALQGPAAVGVLSAMVPGVEKLIFMTSGVYDWQGEELWISRSGYTGEDGFEISVPNAAAVALAEALAAHDDVEPIGLGARDSLRLEAGLPLYGHDLDEGVTPVEAGLTFAIGKQRKMDRDFPGAEVVMGHLLDGAPRKKVGIRPDGRVPAREGALILNADGEEIGVVTSGGFGPSVGGPVALGFVKPDYGDDGEALTLMVRGKAHPATVVPTPFHPHSYFRGKMAAR